MSRKLNNKIYRIRNNFIENNSFIKGVMFLLSGSVSSQLLMLLSIPIITRLYSPYDFGIFSIFVSLTFILAILSCLRFDLAIPIAKTDKQSLNIVALSISLNFLFCFVLMTLILLIGESFLEIINLTEISEYFWMLPIAIFFASLYEILSKWSIRKEYFKELAITKIYQVIALSAIQMLTFTLGGMGLILGHLSGKLAGNLKLFKLVNLYKNFHNVSKKNILSSFIRYKRFALFSAPAGLIRVTGLEIVPIVLTSFFNPAAAGLYALTNRVLNLPSTSLGNAISQVFFSRAPKASRDGSLANFVNKIHTLMASLGMPAMILLVIIGPNLFASIFGEDWQMAGELARWIAPWAYLNFVSSPLSTLTAVLEKQKEGLIFHISLFMVRIMALSVGVYRDDFFLTVILFSVANILWRFAFLLWLVNISGNSPIKIIISTLTSLMIACLLCLPIILVMLINEDLWLIGTTISLVLIAIFYFISFQNATNKKKQLVKV